MFFSILFFPFSALAGDFEGEIIYKITYEDGIDKQILEILPSKTTLVIKDKKSFAYTDDSLGNQGIIYDAKKKVSLTLVDLFSKALAIKKGMPDILKDREAYKVEVHHTEQSKIIQGYSCRKIILTAYIPKIKELVNFEAFYTVSMGNEEWINEADPIYFQVKGTLLEYEIQMGSVFMKYKAEKINPIKISDSRFKVSKSYTIVSPGEAEKILKNQ